MSFTCSVLGCKNTNKKSSEWFYDGRFIKFPAKEELRQKWRESLKITKGYVCGIHFEASAWRMIDVIMEVPLAKRRIKPGAIPTLISGCKQESKEAAFDETYRKQLVMNSLRNSEKICNASESEKRETAHNELIAIETSYKNLESDIEKPQFEILSTELIYGEVVFSSIENKLIVCCKFCIEKYDSLELFRKHIFAQHIQVYNNAILYNNRTVIAKLFANNKNLNHMEAFSIVASIIPFDIQDTSKESLIINLIELYEKHPSLWNLNHADYAGKFGYIQDLEKIYQKVIFEMQNLNFNSCAELVLQLENLNNWFSAVEHIRLQSERDKTTFVCKYINLYNALQFLRGHVPPYQCNICQVVFNSESNLLKHLSKNRKCSNRLKGVFYECQYCNKRFAEQRQLKCHIRQHTNERPYQCTVCEIKFRNYSTLYRHKQRKHNKQKSFQCNSCKRAFYTNGALLQHQNLHYGVRNAICDVCGRRYLTVKYLSRHIKALHTKQLKQKLVERNKNIFTPPTPQRKYVTTIVQNKQLYSSEHSKTFPVLLNKNVPYTI